MSVSSKISRVVNGFGRRAARAAGIPTLEYVAGLEERRKTLAALSMPMLAPQGYAQADMLRFCAMLSPTDVEGRAKTRLGNANDGGYIFIDDFEPITTVISCGISNDVSCDLAFAELGKGIIQFDHTVEGPPVPHARFDFRKQAIDALLEIDGSVRLWDIVPANAGGADHILKIDIEGEEWSTFANYPVEALRRYRQVSCEFHDMSRMIDPATFALRIRAVQNLAEIFFPVHLHANNYRGFSNLLGVPVPETFEVTFASREHYQPGSPQKGAPSVIDSPNDVTMPDLFLGSPFGIV